MQLKTLKSTLNESNSAGEWQIGHEIHVAAGLHPDRKVRHYADENGTTPEVVAKRVKANTPPNELKKHVDNSNKTVHEIHEYLRKHYPEHHVVDSAWTSTDASREHFTGTPNTSNNQGGDVTVRLQHPKTKHITHVALSLKYAKSGASKISLSNNTPKSISHAFGMKPEILQKHADAHANRVKKITGTDVKAESHDLYKKWSTSKNAAEKRKADDIEKSSYDTRSKMLGEIHKHMSGMSQAVLKHHLTHYLAPEQSVHTVQVQTHPETGHVSVHDRKDDVHERINKAKKITVHHDGGMNLYFKNEHGKNIGSINAVHKGRPARIPGEFIARDA